MSERPKKLDLKNIPEHPGVYKFYREAQLIYVGKAKNLKKRVASYFTKASGQSLKTRKLIQEIERVDYVVVDSEYDALLLENNLIKENQPRYNILLRDDKSFPFICISNDRYPKIFSTRSQACDGGEYFGPYTSTAALNHVLELIRSLYKVRTCNYLLSKKNIVAKRFKVCLDYHIGNCMGPCEGLQSEEDYLKEIQQARHIIKGHLKTVKDYFRLRMMRAAEALAFEEAQVYKRKMELLDKFRSKTVIVNQKIKEVDIMTITSTQDRAFINYMKVENGRVNISNSMAVKKKLEESDEQLLQLMAIELRKRFDSHARLILSNKSFTLGSEQIEVVTPQIGDKKKLLDLSLKNALYYKKEELSKQEQSDQKDHRVLRQLKEDLALKTLPRHIECFDNSNIQGTHPVAAMVCFKNGKPAKKDYRRFKIKTVTGADDFSSMKEIVSRRYKRLKEEKKTLPDLVVIDGGKGQLSAACEALKALGLYSAIPVIGIAKRLEEIYYPEDSIPMHISKKSESLKLIQHLRDEAHRFAVTFHTALRSQAQVKSAFDEMKGIGEKTKNKLLAEFKSFKKLSQAAPEAIESVVGKAKTQIILDYIKSAHKY